MIIALSTDSETIIGARFLADLYEESIVSADQFFDGAYIETNLSQPQRLTFLSHSKTDVDSDGKTVVTYAGLTATAWVERFTASISPEQAHHITQIDMIGCNIGHINAEGLGFVLDVASQLKERGYTMPINTFMSEHNDFNSFIVNCCPRVLNGSKVITWRLLGLETAEDAVIVAGLEKKLHNIKVKAQILNTELKDLSTAKPTPMSSVPQSNSRANSRLMTLSSPQQNPMYASQRKQKIMSELTTMDGQARDIARHLESKYRLICLTESPRELFNEQPSIYNASLRTSNLSPSVSPKLTVEDELDNNLGSDDSIEL